ncbi:MAG: phage virion morphogenesis protein [Roseburia sp.]|nr:phage virion morphogenesis protein [Roseburia sp.]
MSSVSVRLDGELDELLARLNQMSGIDKAGVMNAIAEGLRASTLERFQSEESPEGSKWKPSIRATRKGGKTLTASASLKNSIEAEADGSGAAVGTNLIYAATHQFGADRTIRAKNSRYLRFQIGDRWVSVPSVRVNIPARPFLGVSKEDEADIKEILEEIFEE